MKLWLLEQTKNNNYETYDSCVVVAETEGAAKNVHPDGDSVFETSFDEWTNEEKTAWFSTDCTNVLYVGFANRNWCSCPENVTATYIGEADSSLKEGTVICASFNAG